MRGWLRIGVVLSLLTIAGVAASKPGGITGHSGKQGPTCNTCHNGGKTPTVKIEGPNALDAGAVAVYTFHITTDASTTGMNAAVTDGVLADLDGGNTLLDFDELTHPGVSIKPDAATNEAIYTFQMTAPAFGGTVSLFAAGNACNGDNTELGDQGASAKLDIAVNGPPKPPPPEAGPPKPPVVNPPVDSGAPKGDSGSVGDVEDDPPPPADESGCNIGFVSDRSSVPAGAMLAALIGLAMVGRKRRRR